MELTNVLNKIHFLLYFACLFVYLFLLQGSTTSTFRGVVGYTLSHRLQKSIFHNVSRTLRIQERCQRRFARATIATHSPRGAIKGALNVQIQHSNTLFVKEIHVFTHSWRTPSIQVITQSRDMNPLPLIENNPLCSRALYKYKGMTTSQ